MAEVSPSESLSNKPRVAVFGFAGFAAGGSNNAQYEKMLKNEFGDQNIMAISSASTKFAFGNEFGLSADTYKSNEYYTKIAQKATERFADHDVILIHCHSGGGIEGIEFARALLENDAYKGKKISFLFTGVPGFAEQQAGGLRREFEFLGRYIQAGFERAEYQHFDLCPPPEKYYEYRQRSKPEVNVPSNKSETVYQDNPETRKVRRDKFYDQYMSFLSPEEKIKVTEKLAGVDKAIEMAIQRNDTKTETELKQLMASRAKLVFSIGGDRYYNEYLANKPEYKNVPGSGFDGTKVGALYLIRLIASVGQGMENRLSTVLKLAQKRGVEANFAFGLFEKEKLVQITDVPHMEQRLKEAGVMDNFISWLLIEGLGHESVDNSPQGILQALLNLKERSVSPKLSARDQLKTIAQL